MILMIISSHLLGAKKCTNSLLKEDVLVFVKTFSETFTRQKYIFVIDQLNSFIVICST